MSSRSQSEFPRPGAAVPWMTQKKTKADTPRKEDPLIFHQEIMSFVRYIKLSSDEKEQRNAVVDSLTKVITKIYPSARVEVYGSFETDLCLPQSDIDVVVFGTGMNYEEPNASALFGLSEAIMASGMAKSLPTVISSARVPIIKFQEETTGVMVDVSFECSSALATTHVIKNYCKRYPFLRPLTLVVKFYLKQRYLNETWSGGIGSYTLVVMVLSFLQMQTATGGRTRRTEEGEDLSTLLLQFLQFYGSQFDYFHNVISVIDGGAYLRKEDKNWTTNAAPDALSIEDPTNPELDLAAASFRIQDARAVFMEGFWRLTHESPRWANTHSFLARLFDHGPLPEGVDLAAITLPTASSPRAGSNKPVITELRTSTEALSVPEPLNHSPRHPAPSEDQAHHEDLEGEGKSPQKQGQQKTPAKKKQQHRRQQHSPNGPSNPQPTQNAHTHEPKQPHGHPHHGAPRNQRKTPNHSPKKNGAPVTSPPRHDGPAEHSHTLDPAAPEYHPLFPIIASKAPTDQHGNVSNGNHSQTPARTHIASDDKSSLANAS